MATENTEFCQFQNCTQSIRKDNQTGRCRTHRRAKEAQSCSFPNCDKLIKIDSLSGFCSQHGYPNYARDGHANSSTPDETESTESGPGLLSIEPYPTVPTIPSTAMPSGGLILRDHDHAIIHALDQVEDTPEHKSQTTKIMNAVGLEPVAIIDSENVECNLLGKPSVIHALELKQKRGLTLTIATNPKKNKVEDTLSPRRMAMPIDLDLVLRNSFARNALESNMNRFMKMTDDAVNLLNQDWLLRPQMRFFAAKVLTGAILVNPISSIAILINSIEVYGRSSLVDAHHERCLNKRGIPAVSTNPPVNCRYKRIWAISVKDSDGTKLNVATKSFNALVTSSIRLDAKHAPELGPTTSKFLVDKEHGRQVQIFLNEDNYTDAAEIALNEHATNISDTDVLQQLRQIRSKFNEHSSYIPSRSSSSLCGFHRLQPQTIFTYCTFDKSAPSCDGRLASRVFAHVATEVIKRKDKAMLDKHTITAILAKCKPDGRTIKVINEINALFPHGSTSIEILNSSDLCKSLQVLAQILQPYLSSANEKIATEIGNLV
jgi:hypothetical protein